LRALPSEIDERRQEIREGQKDIEKIKERILKGE